MCLGKVIALQLTVTLPVAMSLCGPQSARAETDAEMRARAEQLAHKLLLIDTHLDTPYELRKKMQDISGRIEGGHFDYTRARQGGLDAAVMAVYVPPRYEEEGGARAFTDATIDGIRGYAARWPDQFVLASSPQEVRSQSDSGRVTLVIAIENGSALEDDLKNLKYFHDRGVQYITLCHSKNNHLCDSSFDDGPQWHGLSPFGKQVVAGMNRIGMMIDVSHISDEAFYQVIELSKAPVVATHSACRHFTPGWQRNMSDEMIRALAAGGGVIQINFGSVFVNTAVNAEYAKLQEIRRDAEAKHLKGQELEQYLRQQWQRMHVAKGSVSDVADHIDHAVKLVGIEHVGLGSDFDGVEDVPQGLEDVSCYPNLIYELLKRGYSDQDLKQVCAENFLRVWTEVSRLATAR